MPYLEDRIYKTNLPNSFFLVSRKARTLHYSTDAKYHHIEQNFGDKFLWYFISVNIIRQLTRSDFEEICSENLGKALYVSIPE